MVQELIHKYKEYLERSDNLPVCPQCRSGETFCKCKQKILDEIEYQLNLYDCPRAKESIKSFFSPILDIYARFITERMIPENIRIEDMNTIEEEKLLTEIFGTAETPEFMKERRYGYNLAISEFRRRREEILSKIK